MTASRRNRVYVSRVPQFSAAWMFKIPARASRISEEPAEFLEVSEAVFDAMGEFIVPLAVEVDVRAFPDDEPMAGWFKRDSHYDPMEARKERISGSDELSFETVREHLAEVSLPEGSVRWLREWRLKRSRAWMAQTST